MSKKWVVISQVALGSVLLATGYLVFQRRASRRLERGVRSDVTVHRMVGNSEQDRLSLEPQNVDDLFDFAVDSSLEEAESSIQPTVLPLERVPAPTSVDDDEAPAPEDLGEHWLSQATETESTNDSLDVENLSASDVRPDDTTDGDDETTREYIRKHRISSMG